MKHVDEFTKVGAFLDAIDHQDYTGGLAESK